MVDTLTNRVRTVFVADTSQATRNLMNLSGAMSGLGGRATLAGLASVGGMVHGITASLMGVASVGVGSVINRVVALNSQFEETRNLIGGVLQVMGFAEDFTGGQHMADSVVNQIRAASAALPGELSDYTHVFQTGLAAMASAMPDMQLAGREGEQSLTSFSNRFTAFGAMFNLDTARIGRDLNAMLNPVRGNVNTRTGMFSRLLPFMKRIEGQAGLTTRAFNDMSAAQRAGLLQQTMGMSGLDDMLRASMNTWEARVGTAKTAVDLLLQQGALPLFDAMKSGLQQTAELLMNSTGQLTPFGETLATIGNVVSNQIVRAFVLAKDAVVLLGAKLRSVGETIMASPAWQMLGSIGNNIGGFMNVLQGPAARGASEAGTSLIQNSIIALIPLFEALTAIASPLVEILFTWKEILWTTYEAAFVPFFTGLTSVINWLYPLADGIAVMFAQFTGDGPIGRAMQALWQGLTNLVTGVMEFAGPTLAFVGKALMGLIALLEWPITKIIETVGFVLGWIGEILRTLGSDLGESLRDLEITQKQASNPAGGMGFFERLQRDFDAQRASREAQRNNDSAVGARGNVSAPTARSGSTTNNDFRYSRFDITQKFEEGFDPDRIAVMFANDLGRVGELRLQSGLEPAFSIR